MSERRQQPGIWSCGVGSIAGIVAWAVVSVAIFFMGPLLGIVFDVVLFVPEQLGVIDHPLGKDEKIEIVVPGEYDIKLGRMGIYHVYGAQERTPAYEVTLTSQATGQRIEVRRILDDDSGAPYSLGDFYIPLYEFDVGKAGFYSISIEPKIKDSRYRNAWIAPSISTNSDLVLILSILVQGMVILGVLRVIYYQRHKTEIQAARVDKSEKSDKFSAWMDDRQDQKGEPNK